MYDFSSAYLLEDQLVESRLTLIPATPNYLVENGAETGKHGMWGATGIGIRRNEMCSGCSSETELQTYIRFF